MTPKEELFNLIDEFLSARDRSICLVWRSEEILVEHFLGDNLYEYLAEPLSLYRPGFTHPYVDEQELEEILKVARNMLASQ